MAEAVDWNDEEVLDIEGVEAVLKTALSGTLSGDVAYDEDKSDGLSASIVDSCLKGLQGLGRPFKFVGEKRGARRWLLVPTEARRCSATTRADHAPLLLQ